MKNVEKIHGLDAMLSQKETRTAALARVWNLRQRQMDLYALAAGAVVWKPKPMSISCLACVCRVAYSAIL